MSHRNKPMKIAMVTDAWEPQVNGVVRTLKNTARELQSMGHTVEMITPLEFRTLPCPTYPDIRLSILPGAKVSGASPNSIPTPFTSPPKARSGWRRDDLREPGHSIHDGVSHAFSRIHQGAHAACRCRGLTHSCAGSTGRRRR